MFRQIKVVLSLIVGILSLNGLFAGVQGQSPEISAENMKDTVNEPTCYGAPAMVFREPEYKELQKQFADLELMYRHGKIDDKTYEIKKKSLKEKMSTFEDNYYNKSKGETLEGDGYDE